MPEWLHYLFEVCGGARNFLAARGLSHLGTGAILARYNKSRAPNYRSTPPITDKGRGFVGGVDFFIEENVVSLFHWALPLFVLNFDFVCQYH